MITFVRLPLAVAFLASPHPMVRLVVLLAAGWSDLVDGWVARHFGPSRTGVFLDPVADKLFMVCAFWVVATSGQLAPYEIVGVLLRDIVATIAFVATIWSRRPRAIPARAGGKAVTVAQVLTLVAFLTGSPLLQPMAWATTAIAIYAIWDYYRVGTSDPASGTL